MVSSQLGLSLWASGILTHVPLYFDFLVKFTFFQYWHYFIKLILRCMILFPYKLYSNYTFKVTHVQHDYKFQLVVKTCKRSSSLCFCSDENQILLVFKQFYKFTTCKFEIVFPHFRLLLLMRSKIHAFINISFIDLRITHICLSRLIITLH